jgi:hypothetical protein
LYDEPGYEAVSAVQALNPSAPFSIVVSTPEKALQAASFVGAKNKDADAVNVSPPLVKLEADMKGEGGNRTGELPM